MMQKNVGNELSRDGDMSWAKTGFNNMEKIHRVVFSDRILLTVFTLHRKYERGEIISRTFSRRKKGWDNKKKSRLVESLLLNIPISVIYMAERTDGRIEIVDGQQRLDAVFDFLNNRFPLTGLTILKELNDKKFKDFEAVDTVLQRKLEEYPLTVTIIKRESPANIRLEIFKRLNQ
jgi:hypothetical protein